MVETLIKSGHTAMLEHGTIYLSIHWDEPNYAIVYNRYRKNPYSVTNVLDGTLFITTNYRVIIENHWEEDLKYINTFPTKYHEKRYTIRVVTNLQVSHELVRHRVMSYAMESSRYCNYSKDKFENELTFIKPNWLEQSNFNANTIWKRNMERVEYDYLALLKEGWRPEQAAQVLPKAAKTELVITGTETQWKMWLNLRFHEKTGKVHPQMKELASLIYDLLSIQMV